MVPDIAGLKMQVLHTADVADAIRRACRRDVRGAFNLAAEPPLDTDMLAEVLGARPVPVPLPLVRTALALAWWAHLIPATRGLFDAVLRLPMMDTGRARSELGWAPAHTGQDALRAAMQGMREGGGTTTAPLAPDRPADRPAEVASGVGVRP